MHPYRVCARFGTLLRYTADDLCGSEAAEVGPSGFIDPGQFHSAMMTGLKPSTVYEYFVQQPSVKGAVPSQKYQFRSGPASTVS